MRRTPPLGARTIAVERATITRILPENSCLSRMIHLETGPRSKTKVQVRNLINSKGTSLTRKATKKIKRLRQLTSRWFNLNSPLSYKVTLLKALPRNSTI